MKYSGTSGDGEEVRVSKVLSQDVVMLRCHVIIIRRDIRKRRMVSSKEDDLAPG